MSAHDISRVSAEVGSPHDVSRERRSSAAAAAAAAASKRSISKRSISSERRAERPSGFPLAPVRARFAPGRAVASKRVSSSDRRAAGGSASVSLANENACLSSRSFATPLSCLEAPFEEDTPPPLAEERVFPEGGGLGGFPRSFAFFAARASALSSAPATCVPALLFRRGGRALPSLMRFCVMRLFSNQVLICFHVTGCASPSPSSSARSPGCSTWT